MTRPAAPTRRPTRLPRVTAAVATLLMTVSLATGCSSSDDTTSGTPESTAPSEPTSPFNWEMVGPEVGQPGDGITETLTNTGRLPDAYQIEIEPAGAATVSASNFNLGPGDSATLRIHIEQLPFQLHVKSIGGGAPDVVARSFS